MSMHVREAVSWDAYMWRKPLGGLPFTHPVWEIMLPKNITMNMRGAENRAARALVMANVTGGQKLYNPCKLEPAPLVHFHEAPKMHGGGDERVDPVADDYARAIAAGATCLADSGNKCVPGASHLCQTVEECIGGS